jgi:hypothetical protein
MWPLSEIQNQIEKIVMSNKFKPGDIIKKKGDLWTDCDTSLILSIKRKNSLDYYYKYNLSKSFFSASITFFDDAHYIQIDLLP